jgi:hypothetical protein
VSFGIDELSNDELKEDGTRRSTVVASVDVQKTVIAFTSSVRWLASVGY